MYTRVSALTQLEQLQSLVCLPPSLYCRLHTIAPSGPATSRILRPAPPSSGLQAPRAGPAAGRCRPPAEIRPSHPSPPAAVSAAGSASGSQQGAPRPPLSALGRNLGCPRAAPAGGGRDWARGGPSHLRCGRAPGPPGGLRSGSWGRAWARGAPPCASASASASAASAASASAAVVAAAAIHCGPGRPSRAPRKRTALPAGRKRPRPRPLGKLSCASSALVLTSFFLQGLGFVDRLLE